MDPERFSRQVVEILAKRAANICSNPDCQAITSGPAEDEGRSITLGEAAHIYGAKPGSARHSLMMAGLERGEITNAIWLCRNCHKKIDADSDQFPADLLFEWRREHERVVSDRLGKSSDNLRRKVLNRQLEEFKNTSYLAEQIIIDKPRAWEYRLTVELLRIKLSSPLNRWSALRQGLYTKRLQRIPSEAASDWFQDKLSESLAIVDVISKVINNEFSRAWGPPGQPGSESEILKVSMLLAEACARLLEWEEEVQFTRLPEEFSELQKLLCGTIGDVITQAATIPEKMAEIFNQPDPQGTHQISIVVALPPNWANDFSAALARVKRF